MVVIFVYKFTVIYSRCDYINAAHFLGNPVLSPSQSGLGIVINMDLLNVLISSNAYGIAHAVVIVQPGMQQPGPIVINPIGTYAAPAGKYYDPNEVVAATEVNNTQTINRSDIPSAQATPMN